MNRHRLKKQTAGVTLKLIAFFAQSSFLLRLRRILMRFIPFLQLQSQVKKYCLFVVVSRYRKSPFTLSESCSIVGKTR
jgi:hypothetical protein